MRAINKTTLKEMHKKQETGKANGIDMVAITESSEKLDENLDSLLARMKT